MQQKAPVAVLGGGSFGTAVANIAAENGHVAYLWMRDDEQAAQIREQRVNQRYLPDTQLSPNLIATDDMATAIGESRLVLVAIPSKSFRAVLQQAKPWLTDDHKLVSLTKGIEPDQFKLMSQVLQEETPSSQVGVLSGPNLAKEIGKKAITATVIASEHESLRTDVQDTLACSYFRVYANTDLYGVELGGALKNIYAIISGMADAMGMGENTKSMLITRSLAEMSRFAVSLGANPLTFLGLSGVGDLVATCSSPLSRNFRVGVGLAQGKNLATIVDELGEVAEGVNTLRLVTAKAEELDIYMPLANGLHELLHGEASIGEVVKELMTGQQTTDVEFVLPRETI